MFHLWGASACMLTVLALGACTEAQKGYEIDGEVAGVDKGIVYLKRYEDKSFADVDSATVQQGKFRFKGVVPEARVYALTTSKDTKYPQPFFLDNEHIGVKLDEQASTLTVSGSPLNDLYFANAPLVRNEGYHIDSLIAAHPASVVGPYFLMKDLAWQFNLDELRRLRSQLDASLNGTFYVNQLDTLIRRTENLQVGQVAPDFTLPDPEGRPVTLSSLRGNYVWVDFWASWCPDCRRENPLVVETYRKYKDKNFRVLGVSLDRQKAAWLNAIEKDNLTWTHVSDLRAWQSDVAARYAIRWIPTGYLLDPNGVIIASSTTGQALADKLAEVFTAQP